VFASIAAMNVLHLSIFSGSHPADDQKALRLLRAIETSIDKTAHSLKRNPKDADTVGEQRSERTARSVLLVDRCGRMRRPHMPIHLSGRGGSAGRQCKPAALTRAAHCRSNARKRMSTRRIEVEAFSVILQAFEEVVAALMKARRRATGSR